MYYFTHHISGQLILLAGSVVCNVYSRFSPVLNKVISMRRRHKFSKCRKWLISIDHTFLECQFTKSFTQEVLQWFNADNNSNFNLNTEDFSFGLPSVSNILTKKLNYTLLFLRYYIYKRKLQNDSPLYYFPILSTK